MEIQDIRPHGQLKRRGLPSITGLMREVLIRLRTAQQEGSLFLSLSDVDPRTIRALEERDWVVSSPSRLNGTYYKITGRGSRALTVYEPTVKRTDGICPRCCERPRTLRSTGKLSPYCKECMNQMSRRKYRLGLYRSKPEGVCARCQKRPRFVASSGRAYCYCKHCKNLRHRREHKRQRRELYKRILAGEHVACRRQGCDQPRYVAGKSVQELCREHYYEYQRDYHRRAKKPARQVLQ